MDVLRFENADYFYLLFALPVFGLLYMIYRIKVRKAAERFASSDMFSKLSPDKSGFKPMFKFILIMLAFSSLVVALANPQIGTKLEEVKREGAEIFVAIDLSNSMKSEDIKPNRLEKAKRAVINMIDKLYNDRIGIIVFAGNAYLHLPLTTDYSAAKLIVSTLDNNIIETQGTAIGSAIELSQESFSENDARNKALIIITDGENHEDDALGAAQEANDNGITIHTIGMGSVEGGPIPIYRNSRRTGFLKDSDGNTVVSKLDAAALEQIASAGDGRFIRSSKSEPDLKKLIDELSQMEKEEFEAKVFTDYEDHYQYFLALAIILLVFEMLVSAKKNKYLSGLNDFAGGKK